MLGEARCADALATAFPSARITLAAAQGDGPEDVLRERRFHYDAVLASGASLESLGELIVQTQPQAALIRIEDILGEDRQPEHQRLFRAAASAGIAARFDQAGR